jgi:hypothetical protein
MLAGPLVSASRSRSALAAPCFAAAGLCLADALILAVASPESLARGAEPARPQEMPRRRVAAA